MICPNCGKEFEPRSGKQVYCNRKCAEQLWWKNHKAEKKGLKGRPKCEYCGKEIPYGSRRSRFCSDDCATEAKKKQLREYHALKEKKAAQAKRRARKPKFSISEINKLALAEHLSYGEYVHKYGV